MKESSVTKFAEHTHEMKKDSVDTRHKTQVTVAQFAEHTHEVNADLLNNSTIYYAKIRRINLLLRHMSR